MDDFEMAIQAVLLAENDGGDDDEEDDEGDEVGENRVRPFPMIDLEWWRRLGDPTFKQHFRMERFVFERLLLVVGRHMTATNRLIRQGEHIDVALMISLWILATPDTFRSTGIKFGKARGSVHNQYKTIIAVLSELRGVYIRWPSNVGMRHIARNFEELYGYPSVCGCIDGCHICITAPIEQPQRYVNYHHDHSLLLQAVCDHRLLFRDVYLGQPGAVGDRRMFEESSLSHLMLTRPEIMNDCHLLGDGAYVLTDKVLVPYRNYGNLNHRQRTHNYILSRCRATIERAFALLKGKWRRLKYFPTYCLEYAIDHIMSCIVLHNFIILEGDECEGNVFDNVPGVPAEEYDQLLQDARRQGHLKREYIAAMLHPEG